MLSGATVMLSAVDERREELTQALERLYRNGGMWGTPRREPDGTVRVEDVGGVTWIGIAVLPEDVHDEGFRSRLLQISGKTMPDSHWRCPVELMPDPACQHELERVLRELRLEDAVDVYQTAA